MVELGGGDSGAKSGEKGPSIRNRKACSYRDGVVLARSSAMAWLHHHVASPTLASDGERSFGMIEA